MMRLLTASILTLLASLSALAQSTHVTCDGVLVEVDMVPNADFPMAVIYDTSGDTPRTCVFDLGRAGHWPLRGRCTAGDRCKLSGTYSKKIGNTYYIRTWHVPTD